MNVVDYPQPTAGADSRALQVLLADDHSMFRIAMRVALAPLGPQTRWFEADSAATALQVLAAQPDIDLALLDLHMPGADGLQWIGALRQRFPQAPLVVVSADEAAVDVPALIALGVAGFIPKSDSAAVILQAVRLVLSGGTYVPMRLLGKGSVIEAAGCSADGTAVIPGLTPRQVDVLRLLALGHPNKLIARQLGLSEGTVKVHLLAIYRVLKARNRTAAVVAAEKWLRAATPQAHPRPGAGDN